MAGLQKKVGYILGTPVPKNEVGVNTGFTKINPPDNATDRSILYITDKEGMEYTKIGEKPAIFSTLELAKQLKYSSDRVYKAALTDRGDDILFLIQEV